MSQFRSLEICQITDDFRFLEKRRLSYFAALKSCNARSGYVSQTTAIFLSDLNMINKEGQERNNISTQDPEGSASKMVLFFFSLKKLNTIHTYIYIFFLRGGGDRCA